MMTLAKSESDDKRLDRLREVAYACRDANLVMAEADVSEDGTYALVPVEPAHICWCDGTVHDPIAWVEWETRTVYADHSGGPFPDLWEQLPRDWDVVETGGERLIDVELEVREVAS